MLILYYLSCHCYAVCRVGRPRYACKPILWLLSYSPQHHCLLMLKIKLNQVPRKNKTKQGIHTPIRPTLRFDRTTEEILYGSSALAFEGHTSPVWRAFAKRDATMARAAPNAIFPCRHRSRVEFAPLSPI